MTTASATRLCTVTCTDRGQPFLLATPLCCILPWLAGRTSITKAISFATLTKVIHAQATSSNTTPIVMKLSNVALALLPVTEAAYTCRARGGSKIQLCPTSTNRCFAGSDPVVCDNNHLCEYSSVCEVAGAGWKEHQCQPAPLDHPASEEIRVKTYDPVTRRPEDCIFSNSCRPKQLDTNQKNALKMLGQRSSKLPFPAP